MYVLTSARLSLMDFAGKFKLLKVLVNLVLLLLAQAKACLLNVYLCLFL